MLLRRYIYLIKLLVIFEIPVIRRIYFTSNQIKTRKHSDCQKNTERRTCRPIAYGINFM